MKAIQHVVALSVFLSVARCGGSPPEPEPAATYTVGGTVTGLAGTLVLTDGSQQLEVTAAGANTSFSFSTVYHEGDSYAVTIRQHPFGQWCAVTNGSGSIAADVSNIAIGCVDVNIMFVTSSTITPKDLGGLAGADAVCAAADGGLPANTYLAWLSTTTTSPTDSDWLGNARGWVRPDGKAFADTVTDLVNPPYAKAIDASQFAREETWCRYFRTLTDFRWFGYISAGGLDFS